MEGLENTTVTTIDQLATLYTRPSERVLRKEIDRVDAVGRAFILFGVLSSFSDLAFRLPPI